MFKKTFAFSLVFFLFTCGHFTLILVLFSILCIGFFLNGFFNPFIAHPRPSFLFEPNFHFSLVFFVHMRHFDIDFLFFFNF